MDSINMMGKLVIRQIVTDGYKQKSGAAVQVEIDKILKDIATYEDSMNKAITKLTLQGEPNVDMYRRQFGAERDKLVAYRDQLKASLDMIMSLPDGEIVETGEGNFLREIKLGDKFSASANVEILLKDDVVIAITEQE